MCVCVCVSLTLFLYVVNRKTGRRPCGICMMGMAAIFSREDPALIMSCRVVRVVDLITFVPYPAPWLWTRTQIRPHKPGWLNGRVQFLSLSHR